MIIAAACDVSAQAMASFRERALSRGVREAHIWGKAALEDMLFQPEYDHLLFAYFGVSLGAPRLRSRLEQVRAEMAVRNKLVRALETDDISQDVLKAVLVRDINDSGYPRDIAEDVDCLPWHLAMIEYFAINGLAVCRYIYRAWLKPDGAWDIIPESREVAGHGYEPVWVETPEKQRKQRSRAQALFDRVAEDEQCHAVREVWGLRYDKVLEVDRLGDGLYRVPHVYVRFDGEQGPYTSGPSYLTTGPGFKAYRDDKELDPRKRKPLFEGLKRSRSRPKVR